MAEYFTKDGDDYKKVEGELLTETEVNNVVKGRAERIAKQQYSDYDELKVKAGSVDKLKSEFDDKLKEKDTEIGKLSGEVTTAKLETEKVKIVNEFKLSDELSEFVVGKDAAEMRERAEKLSNNLKSGRLPINNPGKPADDAKKTDSKALAGKLFGTNKSDD